MQTQTALKTQTARKPFRVLPWELRSPFSTIGGDTRGEAAADRRVKAALANRNQITDDTRFTLTASGLAALGASPADFLDTSAAVQTVRQYWDGQRDQPKPEWTRGNCPDCGAPVVSNCYYIGGKGFVIIFECWESLRSPAPAPVASPDVSETLGVTTEAPRFCIDSTDKANWLLRKLAAIDSERALVKAQADEMMRGLDADAARLKALHEADLQAWAKAELERQNRGKKTLPLLFGTVAFRTVPAALRVTGSREAIEYAQAQGWDVVRSVETLDGEAYRQQAAAVLHETGEVLPGIEIVPERESFSVKFGAKGKGGEAAA